MTNITGDGTEGNPIRPDFKGVKPQGYVMAAYNGTEALVKIVKDQPELDEIKNKAGVTHKGDEDYVPASSWQEEVSPEVYEEQEVLVAETIDMNGKTIPEHTEVRRVMTSPAVYETRYSTEKVYKVSDKLKTDLKTEAQRLGINNFDPRGYDVGVS